MRTQWRATSLRAAYFRAHLWTRGPNGACPRQVQNSRTSIVATLTDVGCGALWGCLAKELLTVKTLTTRSYVRLLPVGLLILMAAGCDGTAAGSNDIAGIIYAIGDVVLAILGMIL